MNQRLLAVGAVALLGAIGLALRGQEAPGDAAKVRELSSDTSVAKVVDREGVAARRPVGEPRWLPADAETRLFAGEWVKTGARGPNALALRLRNGATLTLGPGAQVEVESDRQIHVLAGEVAVAATDTQFVGVRGPASGSGTNLVFTTSAVVRARDGTLTTLAEPPKWLTGYQSEQPAGALGSLLANIDGRDVPLSIGYHKVTVDVRDQVARTVVEESFVNHTSTVLEGVFYFPLPADASVSSFGMWIGDELVEGDLVEKERARAIYEQILREKRDPGLLEWAGGNLFKARVYPIIGEKRVKLAYTQVLRKTGDTFAYHYALQSELLRQNPLARLALDVTVSSTEELVAVASPTHDCRIRQTAHAASVEFTAEEYVPDRDFELRVATKAPARGLTFLDDRRGEEGYFLARIRAPAATLPEAERTQPLDLLLLADTSGSMRGPAREAQLQFIEALLAALGDHDSLQLATCDVETRFAFAAPVACTDENRTQALAFLEERDALGWSDLETGLREACAAARAATQIVYVGDGVPTLGDADPGALALRVPQIYAGRGSVHAVVPGSLSEPLVLRALSRLGGGSLRSIGGGDAAATAFALLAELSGPVARDLTLRIEGLSVAAVYPELLPNLPAGAEQVVVGRFDPKGGLRGKVTLSGTLAEKAFNIVETVNLDDGEERQSFVPRLWARHHLDHLLAQGATPDIKARVIALSEEFQIATPYTSFLVLESEADRERFQVTKRVRMRDGEEFFAKGRDDAAFALLQEQMKRAATWRRGLRDDVLAQLKGMGRDLTGTLRDPTHAVDGFEVGWGRELRQLGYAIGAGGGSGSGRRGGSTVRVGGMKEKSGEWGYEDFGTGADLPAAGEESANEESETLDADAPPEASYDDEVIDRSSVPPGDPENLEAVGKDQRKQLGDGFLAGRPTASSAALKLSSRLEASQRGLRDSVEERRAHARLDALFPQIAPPRNPVEPPLPLSADVLALRRSLDRRAAVGRLAGGLRIATRGSMTDLRDRARALPAGEWLLAADTWAVTGAHTAGANYAIDWKLGQERGTLRADWLLGRVRAAEPGDERAWPAPFAWYFGDEFRHYREYTETARELDGGRLELTLVHPTQPDAKLRVVIDRAKAAVVEVRWFAERAEQSLLRFGDFAEIAGSWWPRTIEIVEPTGRVASTSRVEIEALDATAFLAQMDARLAAKERAILLGTAPADLAAAKQAVAGGGGRLEDHWLLLNDRLDRGQVDEAAAPLAALRTRLARKHGWRRIELGALELSRRREELRRALLDEAGALAAAPRDCDLAQAGDLLGLAAVLDAGQERLALLRALEPVFRRQRQEDAPDAEFSFDQQVVNALANMGRADAVFAAQEKLARDHPDRADAQTGFAYALSQRGESDRGLAWLDDVLAKNGPWQESEVDRFRSARIGILWNSYRLEDLVESIDGWLRAAPDGVSAWLANQYLSALLMLDRERTWWERTAAWLEGGCKEKPTAGERARLEAAVSHLLGNGYACPWYRRRLQDDEARALATAARALIETSDRGDYARQILTDGPFAATAIGAALREELLLRVEREADTLPAALLARLIDALRAGGVKGDGGEAAWQALFTRLFARWEKTTAADEKAVLESVLLSHGKRELVLAVWRRKHATAPDAAYRMAAAGELLRLQLADPWSAAAQAECVKLLPDVGVAPDQDDADRSRDRRVRILAWFDFVNWAVEQGTEAALRAVPDVNQLPRRKLQAARDEQRRAARIGTRDLLARLAEEAAPDWNGRESVTVWLTLDRIHLDVLLKADDATTRGWLARLLERTLAATVGKKPGDVRPDELVLVQRCARTLVHLLTRASGDALTAQEQELAAALARAMDGSHPLLDGREVEFMKLVALDRGDALEARLAEWYAGGDDFTRMRFGRALAWIRAERGKLAEAVEVLETIAQKDELAHEDWLALSDWQTALGRQEAAAGARLAAWRALDEGALASLLHQAGWGLRDNGDGVPAALPPATIDQLTALLAKAPLPENHVNQVQRLYAATKDFRLLQCLPEGVLGHSAQGIYGFLGRLAAMDRLVDEEATVDRLVAHLAQVAARATTAVDRRALELLRFVAERRAAAQQNGGGPHAAAALAALERAFDRAFEEGELRLYARFLASMGALPDPALNSEQSRQLGELFARCEPGSEERLEVARSRAQVQWQGGARDAAIRSLGAELDARRDACAGVLPDSANGAQVEFAGWLTQVGAWRAAEKSWQDLLAAAGNPKHAAWVDYHLHGLYAAALGARGATSLGSGRELYAAAQKLMVGKLGVRADEGRSQSLVQQLAALWNAAGETGIAVADDLSRFAYQVLPRVLGMYQYRGGQAMVGTVAQVLAERVKPAAAVEFLVTRAENEPRWLTRANQDFWDQHAWNLARWRHAAGRLNATLEQRLLALTVTDLKEEMRRGDGRARGLYDQRWDTFWREHRGDFGRAAKEVATEHTEDEGIVVRVADYLFEGLALHDEGIALLFARHRRGALTLDGQATLCRWLDLRNRFAEALPLLAALIDRRPDALELRLLQLRALHGTRQFAALAAARSATEAAWRERKQWDEPTIATLAQTCLDTGLLKEAAAHFGEAITLHMKATPRPPSSGDGSLAEYYRRQSHALSRLGRTADAVNAAAGAVLAWSRNLGQRQEALQALENAVAQAPDLDRYVGELDAETARTGLENPIVRKALGKAFLRKGEWDRAAGQLRAAIDAAPNDAETHQLLVETFDRMKRPELATAALEASLEETGHAAELASLIPDLGRRLTEMGDAARAERVHTHQVEMLPNESESHEALAHIREAQQRFADAADQWRQVTRVRSKEPTGRLGLAKVLLRMKEWKEAAAVLGELLAGDWDARFGDIKAEARDLLRQIERRRT